jgi:hypothetical protein
MEQILYYPEFRGHFIRMLVVLVELSIPGILLGTEYRMLCILTRYIR